MKTMSVRSSQEPSSLSFSRRYFNLRKKADDVDDDDELVLTSHSFCGVPGLEKRQEGRALARFKSLPKTTTTPTAFIIDPPRPKKVPKFGSLFAKRRPSKVIGTLFGYRRGHVRIAFQEHPKSAPAFLIEVSTPTGLLVKEMACGVVRVAFECERRTFVGRKGPKLLDEPVWRAYCNGNKCGPATRGECGARELGVLAAVGPVTMGAGVLPDDVGGEGELMYMRAVFERVAGSTKDSEAFYMVNPDGSGGPELSLFFLRV